MRNQVLSIEQMQKLKELGVDINKASMHFLYMPTAKSIMSGVYEVDDEPEVFVSQNGMNHEHPTFTLQDIIELLPRTFMDDINKFHLVISTVEGALIYIVGYVYDEDVSIDKKYFCNESIINAAYDMLIWVAENGYLKTK